MAEPEPLPAPGPSRADASAGPDAARRAGGEPEPEEEPLELLSPEELAGGLEALLFVMDDPVDEETLAGAMRCTVEQVRTGLADVAAGYDERRSGLTLRKVGEGWRLYTREEHAGVVERYLVDGQRSRLTQAALETLAVIAYRQPVTRARVSGIRGVGVDGVMRTLLSRGLVHEVGTDPDTGGGLYATTPLFLERLGCAASPTCRNSRRCCRRPRRCSTSTPTADPAAAALGRCRGGIGPQNGRPGPRRLGSRRVSSVTRSPGSGRPPRADFARRWAARSMGHWAAMNTATPDDETTTAAGAGWSEDMELAPVHPGDREPADATTTARGSACRRCSPVPAWAPAASART